MPASDGCTSSALNLPREPKALSEQRGAVQSARTERSSMMPPNNAFASQALPPRFSASVLLSNGVTRLEGTLKLTTAILALAAGGYPSLSSRGLLHCMPAHV